MVYVCQAVAVALSVGRMQTQDDALRARSWPSAPTGATMTFAGQTSRVIAAFRGNEAVVDVEGVAAAVASQEDAG